MASVLEFENVSKRFLLRPARPRAFLEALTGLFRRRAWRGEEMWALRDVSLEVAPGEALGVVGDNGAGKSTLLKLAARIVQPTRGRVVTRGRVGALLEVGVGFHPDLTGRENVYLSGSLVGMTREEMAAREEEIIAFSGVGDYIDLPVRTYSSGMQVRLGFSVATSVSPDILLVDEVLSVGDQAFRQRCLERIARMRAQGTAIVYVSHSLEEVRRVCDRVIWLKGGRLHGDDRRPAEVLRAYLNHTLRERGLQVRELGDEQERGRRFGSGEVEIAGAATLDEEGRPCNTFVSGAPFGVRLDYRCLEPVDRLAFGLSIYAEDGTWVTSPNSIAQSEGLRVERSGSAYYVVESLALRAGVYELTVSVFDPAAPLYKPYDHLHRAYSFVVQQGAARQDGLVEFPHRWLDGQGWERVRGQGKH